jgi:hypothetical protein
MLNNIPISSLSKMPLKVHLFVIMCSLLIIREMKKQLIAVDRVKAGTGRDSWYLSCGGISSIKERIET